MHSKVTKNVSKWSRIFSTSTAIFFNAYFDDFSYPVLLGPILNGKMKRPVMIFGYFSRWGLFHRIRFRNGHINGEQEQKSMRER